LLLPVRTEDKLFYGWVLVVAFLLIGTILFGVSSTFGIFFKPIESEFSLSRTATSGIFSAYMAISTGFCILGGWALDRYGPRIIILLSGIFTGLSLLLTSQTNSSWQLFVTYSLLLSIGISPIYVVTMSTISRWFNKKRGLAIGIASSGDSLGTVIMAPLATFLITKFDWRLAYITIGIIAWLFTIPLSRLLKKDPYEIRAQPDGANSSSKDTKEEKGNSHPAGFSLSQALRTKNAWLFILVWILFAANFFLVLTHLVPHITDIGYSAGEAATVLSLMSGMTIAGKVLMGRVSDSLGRKKIAFICSILQAIAMIWLIWAHDLWMIYLFAIIFGFTNGGQNPAITALIGDIFGLRNIGIIMGVLNMGFAAGAAIGPAVGGFIFDSQNSYSIAFSLGAVVMLILALLITLIKKTGGAKEFSG
jgi:MFS family permease